MNSICDIFHPITSAPFRNNPTYREIYPCDILKPYIRCFWGSENVINNIFCCDNSVVIPDTCMDIIFNIDYTRNTMDCSFCTIDEYAHTAFNTCSKIGTASFGIRFYPWSAILFSDSELNGMHNQSFDASIFFNNIICKLKTRLWDTSDIFERVKFAEEVLIRNIPQKAPDSRLMNSIYYALTQFGSCKISDICSYTAISNRQLERIFQSNIGVSPKAFLSLIRYQMLWHDMLYAANFNILDAVDKFGYFDQAHLLNDFKKHHLMTPKEAVAFALNNR